jgi:GTPase
VAKAPRPEPKQRTKKSAPAEPSPAEPSRAGTVALIGRPNVGKSTFLNTALGQPLAIVSPTPQTTRDAILGVLHRRGAELALLDTPGLHRPRTELGRVMNEAAREAARAADVVVFMAEVPVPRGKKKDPIGDDRPGLAPHPGDLTLLKDIGADRPIVLVLNKVDRIADKARMLPLLEALSRAREFAAVVPISALKQNGVERVLDEVAKLLPEGPWQHGPDDITDRPMRFFAAEYVREQILAATQAEVPHAVAIVIDRFVEPAGGAKSVVHIDATICVERQGQKRILIGAGGEMLKRIGTQARLRIEELVGQKVNLKLWVKVVPEWRKSAARLEELGYGRAGAGGQVIEAVIEGDDDEEAS